jgi:putative transposase
MSEELALPDDQTSQVGTRDWPHAPPHRLESAGVYFLTARTYAQIHHLHSPERRDWFQETLFGLAKDYGWKLEAWAILSNHYHLIGHSPLDLPDGAASLSLFVRHLHSVSARRFNLWDASPGRSPIWQNFRETNLTFQRSYLTRLNYVHQNAVHHGLVALGSQWKWCSAAAFKHAASPAWVKTIAGFRYNEVATADGE